MNNTRWDFRAFQLDLARQVERPDKIAEIIKAGAEMNYNVLFLYAEGALEYETHPEISTPFALSKKDFLELQKLAKL